MEDCILQERFITIRPSLVIRTIWSMLRLLRPGITDARNSSPTVTPVMVVPLPSDELLEAMS